MKGLIKFILVIAILCGLIYVDTLIYDWIVGLIPPTTWLGLIKVAIVVVMVIYTSGIIIWLTAILGVIVSLLVDVIAGTTPRVPRKMEFSIGKKSKFQERLDKIAEDRKDRKLE